MSKKRNGLLLRALLILYLGGFFIPPELPAHDLKDGNIERYPSFAFRTLENKKLTKSWNWVGFPVLPNLSGTPHSDVLHSMEPHALQFQSEDHGAYFLDQNWNITISVSGTDGYKLEMSAVQPDYTLRTAGQRVDPSSPVTLHAGVNWISYFPQETAHVWDAIPEDIVARLTAIRGEDWYMLKFKNTWAVSTGAGILNYGEMVELTLSAGADTTLVWGQMDTPVEVVTRSSTTFEVNELADYSALVIDAVDEPETVAEIGLFVGDTCIGAEVVDAFPVYMQAYNGEVALDEVSVQVLRSSALGKGISSSNGLQAEAGVFEHYALQTLSYEQSDSGLPLYHANLGKLEEPPISQSRLHSAYPNPFNPSTTLRYDVAKSGHVSVVVYNLKGRVVENLYQGVNAAGQYTLNWDGSDQASGIYVIVFKTRDAQSIQKVMLLK